MHVQQLDKDWDIIWEYAHIGKLCLAAVHKEKHTAICGIVTPNPDAKALQDGIRAINVGTIWKIRIEPMELAENKMFVTYIDAEDKRALDVLHHAICIEKHYRLDTGSEERIRLMQHRTQVVNDC